MALEEINNFSIFFLDVPTSHRLQNVSEFEFFVCFFFFTFTFGLNIWLVYKPHLSLHCLDLAELTTVQFGSISSPMQLPPL